MRGLSRAAGGLPRTSTGAYIVVCVALDLVLLVGLSRVPLFGDARSWHEIDLAHLYDQASGSLVGSGAFRYAPIIGQAFSPLALVPWPAFVGAFSALQLAVLVSMSGRRWWLALVFPGVVLELAAGNIELLMAGAIVLGFRYPAAWSFLLLTKVTPGVGVLWFAFRREWRSLGVALAATGGIIALGVVLAPALWVEWVGALRTMAALPAPTDWPPLVLRLPVAVGLLWWGARNDRRWIVPVASFLALPTIWAVSYALLAGAIALGAPLGFALIAAPCLLVPGPAAFLVIVGATVVMRRDAEAAAFGRPAATGQDARR
jgi:Glycosyltransferase family 87